MEILLAFLCCLKVVTSFIFSFKYVGTVASITDTILSFMKSASTCSDDGSWHGSFISKIKGETEQKLMQIELSQRLSFRAVSTSGSRLDRRKGIHLPASNASCPRKDNFCRSSSSKISR